jgi:hypothetical protein
MTETSSDPAIRLLEEAMADYPADPARGDFLLDYACTQAADPLPFYRVLYKFHNRRRQFGHAREFAARALAEAARQAGLPGQPARWTRAELTGLDPQLASHLLLSLKALSFIALRSGDAAGAAETLAALRRLDPEDGSGGSVVEALARECRR